MMRSDWQQPGDPLYDQCDGERDFNQLPMIEVVDDSHAEPMVWTAPRV